MVASHSLPISSASHKRGSDELCPANGATNSDKASVAELWHEFVGHEASSVYSPGVRLVEQGSACSEIYFVRAGLIKLQSTDSEGHETIIGIKRSGRLVGVEAAIMHKAHLVSAVTVTECRLHRFSANRFLGLIQENPTLSWHLHEMSASELRETTVALMEAKSQSAVIRLKRLVFELVPDLNRTPERRTALRLPFRHREVAQILGVTPEHLSRLLRRLEKEGFLGQRGAIKFACM